MIYDRLHLALMWAFYGLGTLLAVVLGLFALVTLAGWLARRWHTRRARDTAERFDPVARHPHR